MRPRFRFGLLLAMAMSLATGYALAQPVAVSTSRGKDLLSAFGDLARPENTAGARVVRDGGIVRTSASPEIEARNLAADIALKEARSVRMERESQVTSAKLRVDLAKANLTEADNALIGAQQAVMAEPFDPGNFADLQVASKKSSSAKSTLSQREIELENVKAAAMTAVQAESNGADEQKKALNARQTFIAEVSAANPEMGSSLVQSNTIILRFRDDATIPQIREVITRHGLSVRSGIADLSTFFVELPGADGKDEVGRLRKKITELKSPAESAVVLDAFLNTLLGRTSLPRRSVDLTLPNAEARWDWFDGSDGTGAARALKLPSAWNFAGAIRRRAQAAVKVLVIDEGFQRHDDLPPLDIVCDTRESEHGNQVLGIIGAKFDNGLGINGGTPFASLAICAPNVPPLSPQDLTSLTPPQQFLKIQTLWFSSLAYDLYQQVHRQQPRVINISLGYNWGFYLKQNPDSNQFIRDLVAAQGSLIRREVSLIRTDTTLPGDVVIVSAAGNDCGSINPCDTKWTSPFNWTVLAPVAEDVGGRPPAENVLIVESVDGTGKHTGGSNLGTIGAPGEGVVTTDLDNRYIAAFGSSMAAPGISALVSLMVSYKPSLTLTEIRKILNVGSPAQLPNAFFALASCRSADEVAHDLANLNPDVDDLVDLADFNLLQQALAQSESGSFNVDLNGDGVPDLNDRLFARADLNGDGEISRCKRSFVPGLGQVSDLEVMKRAWQGAAGTLAPLDVLIANCPATPALSTPGPP